jgi:hypothetical protein
MTTAVRKMSTVLAAVAVLTSVRLLRKGVAIAHVNWEDTEINRPVK